MKYKIGDKVIVTEDIMGVVHFLIDLPIIGTVSSIDHDYKDDFMINVIDNRQIWSVNVNVVPATKFFRKLYGLE